MTEVQNVGLRAQTLPDVAVLDNLDFFDKMVARDARQLAVELRACAEEDLQRSDALQTRTAARGSCGRVPGNSSEHRSARCPNELNQLICAEVRRAVTHEADQILENLWQRHRAAVDATAQQYTAQLCTSLAAELPHPCSGSTQDRVTGRHRTWPVQVDGMHQNPRPLLRASAVKCGHLEQASISKALEESVTCTPPAASGGLLSRAGNTELSYFAFAAPSLGRTPNPQQEVDERIEDQLQQIIAQCDEMTETLWTPSSPSAGSKGSMDLPVAARLALAAEAGIVDAGLAVVGGNRVEDLVRHVATIALLESQARHAAESRTSKRFSELSSKITNLYSRIPMLLAARTHSLGAPTGFPLARVTSWNAEEPRSRSAPAHPRVPEVQHVV